MKQRQLFLLTLLDKVIVFPVTLCHLEKSTRDHNDFEARVFDVLLYVASCGECLTVSKVLNLPPSCNMSCRDSFTIQSVNDNHTDLYDS